jgi:VWFA-related protein
VRILKTAGLIMMVTLSTQVLAAGHKSSPFDAAWQTGAQNQRPGPPGTIRVRVRLIPVDVVVTDQRDRPVTNLKAEDFQIFENGREQEIRHFSIEKLTAIAPEPGQSPELRKVPTLELVPQSARTFLILLGRGRNQSYFRCVDDLIRFVRKDLLPQDRVAVFAYNRATDFTTDREKITQVLERYKKLNEKLESLLESRFGGLAAIYGTKELPVSLQSDIDRIFAGPEALTSRRVPPAAVPDRTALDKDRRIVAAQENRADEASKISQFDKMEAEAISGGLSFEEFASFSAMTQQDVRNILTCIEYLRYMEGGKHLLFFTGKGLFFPRGDVSYDNRLAAVANDARVAINVFQTGGVPPTRIPTLMSAPRIEIGPSGQPTISLPNPPPFSQSNPAAETYAIQSLRTVAELTGGRTAIFSSIGRTLSLVNETTRVQYLLGYYPKEDTWDGKYRRIQVKVRRPGLKVSFRHGYYARDTIQLYDHEEFLTYSRISAAAGYEFDLADIKFKIATAAVKDASNQPQIKVDLIIDATTVAFKTVNDRHVAKLRIAVFALDSKENLVGEDWKTMNLQLQQETYQRFLQSGIPFSASMALIEPRQVLKVIVYDPGSDKVGSKLVK